jgi:stage II sporulation protein AA (anti-sigma F factor antagonist)
MKATSERLGSGVWLVRVEGEADFSTAPGLEDELQEPLRDGRPRLLMDLSALSYVSSAGLRVLLRARQQAAESGGWLRLFGLQHGVLKVLEEAELDTILPIFATREEAEAAPEANP